MVERPSPRMAWPTGRALFQDPTDLIIETDDSRKGWGAYCQGVRTGGPWSCEEKRLHINYLELVAGLLAIKTFTKSRVCMHVKLLMDSASAVAYINKKGGSPFPESSKTRNISLGVVLPKSLSSVCSTSPLVLECTSRLEIEPVCFSSTSQQVGNLSGRFFCYRLTHQLPKFASWKPDPVAPYTDAFSIDWSKIQGYAFPPFALIGRCLR